MSSAKQIVDEAIANEFILIFGKSWCSYTRKARKTLNELSLPEGKSIKYYELDKMALGEEIQDYLYSLTGHSTVPNIYVQGKHVGGSDDLSALKASGQLAKMVQGDA